MITKEIILEKGDGEWWGRIEEEGLFLFTTCAVTPEKVEANIKSLLKDFIANDGQQYEEWKNVNVNQIEFTHSYDLTAFFEVFDVLKINAVANLAGINKSLMRQYVSQVKYPSFKQVQKIEQAIKMLGKKLLEVKVS